MAVTLRKARTIIRKALDKGRDLELKPLSVVVLDAGGHVIAFERSDGASPGRFGIAHGKAYGAVMLGIAGTAQELVFLVEGTWTFVGWGPVLGRIRAGGGSDRITAARVDDGAITEST